MRNLDHLESLIGSINKLVENAKNKGIIRSKELYLLNLIYKLISNKCFNNEITNEEKSLLNLYYKLFSKYSFLCRTDLNTDYYLNNNTNNLYINTNTNTAPEIDDPDPVDPTPVDPIIIPGCNGNSYQIFDNMDFVTMSGNSFIKCLETTTIILYAIKIVKLPNKGILTLAGNNVIVGQVILFDGGFPNEFINPYDLVYTPFVDRGNNEIDFIEYQVIIDNSPETLTEIVNLEITIL